MKGRFYAIILVVAFLLGEVGVFLFATSSPSHAILAVLGLLLSLVITPSLHELGHLLQAWHNRFEVVYTKFFCFKFYRSAGKTRFGLASPFAGEETRTMPTSGEGIKERALAVVSGGLVVSTLLVVALLIPAVLLTVFGATSFLLWGAIPYAAYLLLLNAVPAQYAGGKTDAFVYQEIKKESVEGKAFLAAMEIQGRLYAGESYGDLPKGLYDTFGLREDEPLYAVLWDLKYRYYLDKNDLEKAADSLNRLILSADYLTDGALESVRIESAYMLLLQGDSSQLKSLLETDEALLRSDDYRIKRLLATYAFACGEKEKGDLLIAQAKTSLENERAAGVRKHELVLLSRLAA